MRAVTLFAFALGALGVAGTAGAAPLARATLVIDGRQALLAIEPSGELTIDGATAATLAPYGSRPVAATLDAGDVGGAPTIVATIRIGADHEQAVVMQKTGAAWREVTRQDVGGVGPDGDYAVAIALGPGGIYRFQARAGFHRCDGRPAFFFAEGWNGTRFQRLSRVPSLVDPAAPVLAARADAAPAPVPLLYQARVASYEPGAGDIGALGVPAELDDGKPATAWTEDFAASSGEGQFFTFESRGGAKATQLRFTAASGAAAAGTHPPKRLAIVGAGAAYHVDLPEAQPGAAFVVDLPQPIAGCVSVVLEESYGPRPAKTAIGELEVFGEHEREGGGGEAVLAGVVASGADGAQAAEQALAHRGAAAVTALAAVLPGAKDAQARGRIVRALIATGDASAGPALATAVTTLRLPDDEIAAALAALGKLGQIDVLAGLVDSSQLDADARVAAVHAIAAAPGGRTTALVPFAGKGPPPVRRAVIDAVAALPVADLVTAAQAAGAAPASGDLWRAVTRRGHVVDADRPAAAAALLAALPQATDYERRYRLVDGLAALGDATGLAALAALLASLPTGAERGALAQVAAHALANAPRAAANALAAQLAADADPGVRLAALSAVGASTDTDAADRVLLSSLQSDPWPELRRHAAEVLGTRCARSAPARALAVAVGRDPDIGVRGASLVSLVQCKAAGTAALLATVWDDDKLPLELRQRAVDLSVALGDAALGAKLVGRLAAWRGAAIESADALALAQNAAYALGRLAPPGAADALLAALGDGAYPEIVAAAAAGLGLLGPACPASARAQLRTLSQNEEQQISVAAARALAQCHP